MPFSPAPERVVVIGTGSSVGVWVFSPLLGTLRATEGRVWVDFGSLDGMESYDHGGNESREAESGFIPRDESPGPGGIGRFEAVARP